MLFASMNKQQRALLALALILPAPLIGVSSSFYLPPLQSASGEIEIGKAIWLLAKIWLVALPIAWLLYVDGGKLSWSPTSRKGVVAGLVSAIPVGVVILGAYLIAKNSLIDPAEAKQTILELGINSPAKFFIFASSMSLVNSLMEEYVWRWFVFSKFKVLFGARPAIVLSAFFFTLHHVVIVWGLGSLWLVFLGSLGLFVGGIVWGWLYNKYNSIWPGWICHVAADTAIMWIAWWILKS
jgi:membrane protease YdiL (CAAX protease family)